ELTQGRFRLRPRYEVVAATGPDHDRRFRVAVHLGARRLAEGEGRSKKQAEQAAARAALEALAAEGEAEAAG
ncbi:MAG: ribonuclease III, partial [Nitrospirae bacterium]